jgi:hypothetical protein
MKNFELIVEQIEAADHCLRDETSEFCKTTIGRTYLTQIYIACIAYAILRIDGHESRLPSQKLNYPQC